MVTAEDAVKYGFANAVIPALQDEPDWFDLAKVPAIGKLLKMDYRTLVNCKQLINAAKDNKKYEEVL